MQPFDTVLLEDDNLPRVHQEVSLLCRVPVALAAALLALAGCNNNDNQVNGGIFVAPQFPNGFIPEVGTAIAGSFVRTDNAGNQFPVSMFILSDQPGLCKKIADHPDFFKNAQVPFVAMILTTAADKLGTFQIGFADGGTAQMLVTAGSGNPVGTFPADLGNISLRQLGVAAGSESDGTFDVGIIDATSRRKEVFGKFKTQGCAAISGLQF